MKKFQFKPEAESEVEVSNGDYRRVFKRAEQPFEVEETHWPLLRRTGHFELVKESAPPPPPPPPPPSDESSGDSTKTDEGAQDSGEKKTTNRRGQGRQGAQDTQ